MDANVRLIDRFLIKTKLSELSHMDLLRSAVYNWCDLILVRAGIKRSALVRFKDGSRFEIKADAFFKFWNSRKVQIALFRSTSRNSNVNTKEHTVKFSYKNRRLRFCYDENVPDVFSVLREVFADERYSLLSVRGKNVIDLGAYMGDTAIYFLLRGAKHVYAFEPDPRRYSLAKKNIRMNGLETKITLVQKRVGNYRSSKRSTSLEGIVRSYKLNSAVLKADCEGCEYPILLEEKSEFISLFGQIQVEYHRGYVDLEKRLRTLGFSVMRTPGSHFFGHLYATKPSLKSNKSV